MPFMVEVTYATGDTYEIEVNTWDQLSEIREWLDDHDVDYEWHYE